MQIDSIPDQILGSIFDFVIYYRRKPLNERLSFLALVCKKWRLVLHQFVTSLRRSVHLYDTAPLFLQKMTGLKTLCLKPHIFPSEGVLNRQVLIGSILKNKRLTKFKLCFPPSSLSLIDLEKKSDFERYDIHILQHIMVNQFQSIQYLTSLDLQLHLGTSTCLVDLSGFKHLKTLQCDLLPVNNSILELKNLLIPPLNLATFTINSFRKLVVDLSSFSLLKNLNCNGPTLQNFHSLTVLTSLVKNCISVTPAKYRSNPPDEDSLWKSALIKEKIVNVGHFSLLTNGDIQHVTSLRLNMIAMSKLLNRETNPSFQQLCMILKNSPNLITFILSASLYDIHDVTSYQRLFNVLPSSLQQFHLVCRSDEFPLSLSNQAHIGTLILTSFPNLKCWTIFHYKGDEMTRNDTLAQFKTLL